MKQQFDKDIWRSMPPKDILIISDLDGTLLGSNARLTPFTEDVIHRVIERGYRFSIATARTAASVVTITANLGIDIPIVLMNGVLVYDLPHNRFLRYEELPQGVVREIIAHGRKHKAEGILYTTDGQQLITYFESLDSPQLRRYYTEDVKKNYETYLETGAFEKAADATVIYFTYVGKDRDDMAVFYDEVRELPGVGSVFVKDDYTEDGWFVECFSEKTSKYNAATVVRDLVDAKKIIGFGDNMNDIPLLRGADLGCATGNANETVRASADIVIGKNTENGVAKWLEENLL